MAGDKKMKEFIKAYNNIETLNLKTAFEKKFYINQKDRFISLYREMKPYINKNERGLDIGVYPGFFTYCLKKCGYNITGLDLTPQEINPKILAEINVEEGDIENKKLPYPNNTFDYIIFTAVIEHLRINPINTMKEINRILKPKGLIIVQTPNLCCWVTRIRILLGTGLGSSPYEAYSKFNEYGYLGHLRMYSMGELREMLENTGSKIIYKKHLSRHNKEPWWVVILKKCTAIIPSMRENLFMIGEKKT